MELAKKRRAVPLQRRLDLLLDCVSDCRVERFIYLVPKCQYSGAAQPSN